MGDGLPVHLTRFVGRAKEIAELRAVLDDDGVRLLTLTGAPGCGKSRLAAEVLRPAPPGRRVGWVALASVGDPGSVADAVGMALGVAEGPGQRVRDGLVEVLGGDEPQLVVIDNCEHVVEAAAGVVRELLERCPALRIVATSRTALGLTGERVWNLEPLDLEPAVELFLDRAANASNHFRPAGDDEAGVEEICRRLAGLPLAIELVAPWTRVLSLDQLTTGLAGVLPLPDSGNRDRLPQHETMAATVDWSYRLLSPTAQHLFRSLSVFAGGFDLDAATALGDHGGEEPLSLRLLTSLVDHSLVEVAGTAGAGRYRLLEPVRQCGERLLAASGEGDAVRERGARHLLALALRSDPWMLRPSSGPAVGIGWFEQEGDNLLAALTWARDRRPGLAAELAVAMAPYWLFVGRTSDGRAWLDDILAAGPADERLRIDALDVAARLAWRQGDYTVARPLFEDALVRARRAGDVRVQVRQQIGLACLDLAEGALDAATRRGERCVALAEAAEDPSPLVMALITLGFVDYVGGDVDRGDERLRAALATGESMGHWTAVAQARCGLQYGALLAGDPAAQRAHLVEALAAMRRGGHIEETDWLWSCVLLAATEGRTHAAARLVGGARAINRRRHCHLPAAIAAPALPVLARLHREVPPAVMRRLEAEGGRLPWEDLVALALAEAPAPAAVLTPRQQEVAAMLAEGQSNVEIAEALCISRRTVETHVEHVKAKLGIRTREEIAAWAPPPPAVIRFRRDPGGQ